MPAGSLIRAMGTSAGIQSPPPHPTPLTLRINQTSIKRSFAIHRSDIHRSPPKKKTSAHDYLARPAAFLCTRQERTKSVGCIARLFILHEQAKALFFTRREKKYDGQTLKQTTIAARLTRVQHQPTAARSLAPRASSRRPRFPQQAGQRGEQRSSHRSGVRTSSSVGPLGDNNNGIGLRRRESELARRSSDHARVTATKWPDKRRARAYKRYIVS